ncbi:MAG TPA: DUF1800 domain-containing protein [Stellaceae bacterium]|nr:DUF1800 domain-containing protein [Stellaceae bacterium]
MPMRFAGLLIAACVFASPLASARGGAPKTDPAAPGRILHVLNRLAFGPSIDDFRHVEAIGVERWIAEQLDPAAIAEPIELRFRLAQLDTLDLDAMQLRQLYGPLRPVLGVKPTPEERKAQAQRARIVVEQAQAARVYRAVLSRRQLQQVMVDFWFNHFNVFDKKGLDRIWIGNFEERAIRPYALGHFRDLLFAVAKHPAMLVYLDNTLNSAPRKPDAHGNERGLNENFGREVMELHTLGVDGGYTQADVITLARVFTGWTVDPPDPKRAPEAAAVFVGARHDFSPKVFLGRPLLASGKAEGEEALDRLAKSPATARHIAFELAQYFVSDAPPPRLVDRLAARFLATGGDIRAVLRTLFASPEFWASAGQKYKTPYEFVISAARASGIPLNNPRPLLAAMDELGMPLYGCQTPDGYKNTEAAWLSPDATLRRISFAVGLAQGGLRLNGTANAGLDAALPPPPPAPAKAAELDEMLGPNLASRTRETVAAAPPGIRAALILGSPDFMRR